MSFTAVELIERKRDGQALSPDAIHWLIDAYTNDRVADYQMSAMAMAIYFNGLNPEELASWTAAMLHSGEVLNFDDVPLPKIDKHSTGGVGDKISIPLAPLVACCGIAVPMISGRGLGHTGGTLDKLETIPGFFTGFDTARFHSILKWHGMVMAGASQTIVPADRKLYALRDSSATVPSIPLISSSIMSKKLAEGLDGLLLDVKTGAGAFRRTIETARELAQTMVGIGKDHGVRTVALITDMSQPLGHEVGNANEIMESVAVLKGEGPDDVTELTMAFGEVMLELGGIDGGREMLESKIESGAALNKFKEVIVAQGGDPSVVEDWDRFPSADFEARISAGQSGYVSEIDALIVGTTSTRLGAGREEQHDIIDPSVSISLHRKVGDAVDSGDTLATVRYNDPGLWEDHRADLETAWKFSTEAVIRPTLILERIES